MLPDRLLAASGFAFQSNHKATMLPQRTFAAKQKKLAARQLPKMEAQSLLACPDICCNLLQTTATILAAGCKGIMFLDFAWGQKLLAATIGKSNRCMLRN